MDGLMILQRDELPSAPVVDLLRSFGFADPETIRVLAALLPADAVDPAGAARTAIGVWFVRLLDRSDVDADEAFRLGRAVFVTLAGASRWPAAFLAEAAPDELVSHLRQSLPVACPPDAPAAMAVQPLDSPAPLASIAAWFRHRPSPARPA